MMSKTITRGKGRGRNRYKRNVDNTKLMHYLETYRMRKGWLRNQFSENAGIGVTTYNNWCNDRTIAPAITSLHQIAETYGLSLDDMSKMLDIQSEERGEN